jgi:uncharacterized membrane protein YdbT with pleckstrin-like domain
MLPFLLLFIAITFSPIEDELFLTIFMIGGSIIGGIVLLAICIGPFLASARVGSLEYRITKTSITVKAGVISKIMKTVPFKRITNVEIYRGLFDRMTGLASIRIHTAGDGGSSTPEGIIEGLEEYQEVYDYIVSKI